MMQADLEKIWLKSWDLLKTSDFDSPLRFPTIATIEEGFPAQRTVVLRLVDPSKWLLCFYADYRSAKIKHLKQNPMLAWHFYHPELQIQLRMQSVVKIENQTTRCRALWDQLTVYARKNYAASSVPGTPCDDPLKVWPSLWEQKEILLKETEYAYAQFTVIEATVTQLEHLHLNRDGHIRVRFFRKGNEWQGQYIVP